MKAMILAGGLSTRLYPLTKQIPKPLVPVVGVPNAALLLRYLKAYGFDDIAINVHYLADAIMAALGDGSGFGVKLHYSYEPELLGSAGGVKNIAEFFGDETFVIVGCDELTDLRLDELVAFHHERKAMATIGLVECAEVDQYGVVILDELGKIVEFQEKPPKGTERSRLANTGIYVFSPEILMQIPAGEFYDFGKQLFPALQAAGERFYGFDARGAYWADIGTPSEYRRASYDVVRSVVRIPQTVQSGIDPAAVLGRDVLIEGPVCIGPRVRLEDGVSIVGPAILDEGVHVERGARLERSILWADATVGAHAKLRDAIVGNGYRVRPETILENALVANDV